MLTMHRKGFFLDKMDPAYERNGTHAKAIKKGFEHVAPSKKNRKGSWEYDKQRYKQGNRIERYFLRLKRFRRMFTRYVKLDDMFVAFIFFAMGVETLVCVNTL